MPQYNTSDIQNCYKLIKEGVPKNDLTFTTKVEDVNVYYGGDTYRDVEDTSCVIFWEADIEVRSWGVKSIIPIIHTVDISYTVSDTEQEGKSEEVEINYKSGNTQGWRLETERNRESDAVSPSSVEVDHKKKTITVYF